MDQERRRQARIQITLEVTVAGPNGVVVGALKDFSQGGATMILSTAVAGMNDLVELTMRFSDHSEVTISGYVMRIDDLKTKFLLAVRFDNIAPAEKDKIYFIIEKMLQSRGSEERKYPRIRKILPIKLTQVDNLRAMIETISMGGMGIKVTQPLVVGQDVKLEIEGMEGDSTIELMGNVLYQHALGAEGVESKYRVGIKFDELSTELKVRLHSLILKVLAFNTKLRS